MTEKGPSLPRQLLASPVAQMILFLFTVAYVISPIDVIPDVLPVIGWLDDLAVFFTQVSAFFLYIRQKRQASEQKQQASRSEERRNGS